MLFGGAEGSSDDSSFVVVVVVVSVGWMVELVEKVSSCSPRRVASVSKELLDGVSVADVACGSDVCRCWSSTDSEAIVSPYAMLWLLGKRAS